ncbi:hypothetical protein RYA07_27510 [Pseudomonas syringae pv. actinidiae]|nr:hypothetical protein [Pseudomonas syringae pv. actinidiae]
MAVTMAAANNERDRQYIQRSFESQVLTGLAGNKPARRPANSYVFISADWLLPYLQQVVVIYKSAAAKTERNT